jgi:hypothetical protein
MAQNSNRKLPQEVLLADLDTFTGLKTVGGYKPSNENYRVENIQIVKDAMENLQTEQLQLETQLATVRNLANKKENEFHELMIGAATSVEAQFGRDSNELQAVGRKKLSDYKKRKAKKTEPK